MVIFDGMIAVIGALSIAWHYKSSNGKVNMDMKLEGGKVMAGLMLIVTGLKAGAGAWRGRL